MCLAVLMEILPVIILLIYVSLSLLTFVLYWHDKHAAENGNRRTPENTLQSLSLIGGWPGGLFAQRILHHKSSKKSFQSTYWLMVVLNITGLFLLASPLPIKYLTGMIEYLK